jgi:UDP-glucose 4-epimerase
MEAASGKRDMLEIFGNDYPTPDGTCIRDYVHVTDLAEGHLLAMEYIIREKKSIKLNLGSENGISVNEMLEAAKKITGKEIKTKMSGRRAGDPVKLIAKSDLAGEILGWKAQFSDVESLIKSSWIVYSK